LTVVLQGTEEKRSLVNGLLKGVDGYGAELASRTGTHPRDGLVDRQAFAIGAVAAGV